MSTGGWGSQIGSAAAGVGGAVASVELAKHDPKLYYKMQMAGMWFMGIVLLLMLIIVGVAAWKGHLQWGNKKKHSDPKDDEEEQGGGTHS